MKLLVGGLLAVTAIGSSSMAQAQVIAPKPSSAIRTQSAPLVTQPASSRMTGQPSRSGAPYTANQLNGLLGTLQANPPVKTAPTNSIESLIQRFSTSTPKQNAIDPIDFFKPPALNDSFKIPLQQ